VVVVVNVPPPDGVEDVEVLDELLLELLVELPVMLDVELPNSMPTIP
jgi:hypothetical protein